MAIISFADTVDEYMSGKKTETRRDWSLRQYMMWVNFWYKGHLIHDAWDKLPHSGGKFIGKFRLMKKPFLQQLKDMNRLNLIAEGGMCSTVDEFCELIGKSPYDWVTVIRFEKI